MTDTSDNGEAEQPTTRGEDEDEAVEQDEDEAVEQDEDEAVEQDEDEAVEQAREAPAGQEERASKDGGEPSQPQQLLDALGEEIDGVRRRVVEQDPAARSEEQFIQEGEADEDEPVDDTIAPPG